METVIRVAVIYLVIMVGLRLLDKREFGQLSPLELVTLMLIPEIVSQALVSEDFSVTNAIIGVATLFSLVFLTSLALQKSQRMEDILAGTPAVLVQHGKLVEESLHKERVTPGEVFAEMRKAGLEHLGQVKWAILEADGKISIVPEDKQEGNSGGKNNEEPVVA